MNRFTNNPIVVPVDFSEEADGAVDAALELATTAGDISAVHVAPPLLLFEPITVTETISDDERRETLQIALRKRYADPKYRGIRFEVRFGDPGQEIVAFAKESAAALIVMPSHGRTGLAHLL